MTTPMPAPAWVRRARATGNHDGDTIAAAIDLGFGVTLGAPNTLRILGINCPELGTPEGEAARAFTAAWLAVPAGDPSWPWPLVVRTVKDRADKYGGRYDAEVWRVRDGASLSEALIAAGHAKPWDGKGPRP